MGNIIKKILSFIKDFGVIIRLMVKVNKQVLIIENI